MSEPVIIEAAINGICDKGRNPNVPCSPEEIAADALECLEAGAAVIHNHTDNPADGSEAIAARQLEGWKPVAAQRRDAILYPTVGFTTDGGRDARFGHVPILADTGLMQMGVFDPGSVNLGGTAEDGLPGGPVDFVYANTFADIRYCAEECERLALGPSIAIFEPGFLKTTLCYHDQGKLPAGAFVKLYFGGPYDYFGNVSRAGFGLPPTGPSFRAYEAMLDGTDLPWAVAVLGGDVTASGIARMALEAGAHVRVGLEDYAGTRKPTNAELVREVVELAREVGREVASCEETRRILGLRR